MGRSPIRCVGNWLQISTSLIYPRVEWASTQRTDMALERAVSSSTTSTNVLVFPKTLVSKPHFSVASSPSWRTRRWKGLGTFKCSMTAMSYPKPSEIPWQKELCNSVNLIGIVAVPVEIKHLPSGKVVAWTCLSVKKSVTQTSLISLTFWDDLALVASQHLQKGHQIHVSGRLITDTVESEEGKTNTYYKVFLNPNWLGLGFKLKLEKCLFKSV